MKKKSSLENNKGSIDRRMDKLRSYIRSHGRSYLDDPNISSIGIGHKVKDGKHTKELCIQFTVKKKAEGDQLEELGTTPIPKSLKIEGIEVPTDVIEREYHASYKVVQPEKKSLRKQRLNTLVPGISISHPKGTAGTLGAITYDAKDGQPCLLSNWHVLHTPEGKIGDPVVQPGPFDDNRISQNYRIMQEFQILCSAISGIGMNTPIQELLECGKR